MVPQKINKIVLHTHGGLGNQIFQVFAALLISSRNNNAEIYLYHSTNYYHNFELSPKFSRYLVSGTKGLILSSRLIKVLNRIKNRESLKLRKTIFLDGYFQSLEFYNKFSRIEIELAIEKLSNLFFITEAPPKVSRILHIRLGDFFKNIEDKRETISKMINKYYTKDSKIISNEEELVDEILVKLNLGQSLIGTKDENPDALLKTLGLAETIISNDSTLAFWAAILYKRKLVCSESLNSVYNNLMGL